MINLTGDEILPDRVVITNVYIWNDSRHTVCQSPLFDCMVENQLLLITFKRGNADLATFDFSLLPLNGGCLITIQPLQFIYLRLAICNLR
ncbi:hypothetical protein D3C80_2029390 [compost metagenome]